MADKPSHLGPPAVAPGSSPVQFLLQANSSMQDDLVSLGFLADGDRGNADAVADATILLLKNGANLRKDLNDLFSSLYKAKLRFDATDDAGRDGALHALDAVLRFLMLFETVHVESLLTPLALLFGDLVSLDGGKACPMVAPTKKPGGTRASGFYNAMKGIAVFIVRRLEASGISRPDSRKAVARELNKLGVRPARKGSREGSGEFRAGTIAKWEQDVAADIQMSTTAAQEFRQCETGQVDRVLAELGLSSLPPGSTADDLQLERLTPAEFRRAYLSSLGKFVLDTRLSPQKYT